MGLFGFGGKSNRPDFTPDMMPKNRFELFFEMLKLNLFNLFKLNALYFVFWIPFWLWSWMNLSVFLNEYGQDPTAFANDGYLMIYLIGASLCIAITGPAKCALKYITRNIARDEHIWLWSDFITAFKENWKQGLAMSALNGVFVFTFIYGVYFYNIMANTTGSYIYLFMQVILIVLGRIYMLMNIYTWPMMITYDLKFGQIIRNSLVLAVGRLPQTLLFGLLTALPVFITVLWMPALIWYFIFGYSFGSFVNCSYTNAAFDKFFNTRIEGAETGKGMLKPENDDDWEDLDPDEDNK